MLFDSHLPYRAHVPWPLVARDGSFDWVSSMDLVEDWLCTCVSPHGESWAWTMDHMHWCSVCFAREADTTLFLLRFGS